MFAPPFEPPLIVSLSAAAYLFFTRYSLGELQQTIRHWRESGAHDAAMKSSKQLTCAGNLRLGTIEEQALQVSYLSLPRASKVPLLTKLASTSNVGNSEHPLAFLDEFQDGSAEERVDGDVETSVSYDPSPTVSSYIPKEEGKDKRTILYGRGGSIQRGILVPHDEHRNFGPILTLIPDLFRNEIIR